MLKFNGFLALPLTEESFNQCFLKPLATCTENVVGNVFNQRISHMIRIVNTEVEKIKKSAEKPYNFRRNR